MSTTKDFLSEKYNFNIEEMQLMIESIPANVFYKDTKGRYQMTSHICQMLSGGEEGFSIVGKTDLDVQPDKELAKRFYQEDLEVVRTGNSLKYLQEMEFSGIKFYYEISKAPVKNQEGEIIGLMGYHRRYDRDGEGAETVAGK